MAKKLNTQKTTQAILKNVSDGLNDYQIYTALKVASSTFQAWKKEHTDEYNEAKEIANVKALEIVESHLNKKIFGGWRIKQRYEIGEDGSERLVSYERQQVDPELNAIMFYLRNKAPDQWNSLEIAKLKQDENNTESLRDVIQNLSKYDVKNYEQQAIEYDVPPDLDEVE